ncbi:pro-Pol polyprotein [Apostichopus japonicus]|uniref:Pro-Pol polyprotein n=1 Tax=Stichopus japonicus TaxID=307972 RepID=A0A2G8JHX1_STIJA|nr:pro-Pol polyprotein [Apostichopus japonicus]
MTSSTVIACLCQVFSLFGTPAYIHSDRGAAFLSKELTEFLMLRGVACSRTTSYNPQGNGQTERYNGIVWKTIMLALETRGTAKHWQEVLPDALHSVRSLVCTTTNQTPHERFLSSTEDPPLGSLSFLALLARSCAC